tara:strand:+ start:422 stop:772 length:351 start_codon:yes stop_codon:yes gene_type:complete
MTIKYRTLLVEILEQVRAHEDFTHDVAIRGAWAREWERHLGPIPGDDSSGYGPFDMPTEETFLRTLLLASLSLNAHQLTMLQTLDGMTGGEAPTAEDAEQYKEVRAFLEMMTAGQQ